MADFGLATARHRIRIIQVHVRCYAVYRALEDTLRCPVSSLGFLIRDVYKGFKVILVSTAIGLRKYRIPSDLRSQAQYRSVSTMVGDHMGIPGVVVLLF